MPRPPTFPAPPMVLIVDDYVVERRLAGGIVERYADADLQVCYATNGLEALGLIAQNLPAVVLTDLQMPDMDGLMLVQQIRSRFPSLPVILMTAFGSEEVAMKALRAGAANYVVKKTMARDLPETLRQVLTVTADSRDRQRAMAKLEHRQSRFVIDNDPSMVAPLIQVLQEDLGAMDLCDATARTRIAVALQEALTNAIYHGNLEVSSDLRQEDERIFYNLANQRRFEAPYVDRKVHVQAKFERGQVTYIIRDEGPGFDTSSLDRPIDPEDLMRIGGRGMLLIRTFMDEILHNETGNQITMIKKTLGKC